VGGKEGRREEDEGETRERAAKRNHRHSSMCCAAAAESAPLTHNTRNQYQYAVLYIKKRCIFRVSPLSCVMVLTCGKKVSVQNVVGGPWGCRRRRRRRRRWRRRRRRRRSKGGGGQMFRRHEDVEGRSRRPAKMSSRAGA
jgi:hypothetical protein